MSTASLEMQAEVESVFYKNKKRYGSPRVWRELKTSGIAVAKSTVEKIMKELGLRAKKKKRYKSTTDSKHLLPRAPNLLNREFGVTERNRVWLSDITYLPMFNHGFSYLCVIMDLGSREIIGWSVAEHMETSMVCEAFINAVKSQYAMLEGIIFHSDQGSQYGSEEFRSKLSIYGMRQSMSRRGQCWDNAPMESFFDSLKTEWGDELTPECRTLDDVRGALFEYIEVYYNRARMHSGIDFQIPAFYDCQDDHTL